jgi:hypothetical protein
MDGFASTHGDKRIPVTYKTGQSRDTSPNHFLSQPEASTVLLACWKQRLKSASAASRDVQVLTM